MFFINWKTNTWVPFLGPDQMVRWPAAHFDGVEPPTHSLHRRATAPAPEGLSRADALGVWTDLLGRRASVELPSSTGNGALQILVTDESGVARRMLRR
jgi:hypothetical protein